MKQKELAFVPTAGMGHLIPSVELANHLVHRHPDISVVILIMHIPSEISSINTFVDFHSRDSTYPSRLTFLFLPSLPNDSTSFNLFSNFVDLHKPLVMQAVQDRVQAGSPKPVGFVLDMFCTAMMDVADELQVPSYIYFTSGASLLCLGLHLQSLAHDHGVDVSTEYSNPNSEVDNVVGFLNPIPGKLLPGVLVDKEIGSARYLNHIRRFRQSKGILVNTFMELESRLLIALLEQQAKGEIPTVYPVGPILNLSKSYSGSSNKEEQECNNIMGWLDEQPQSSVVFLCFGSKGYFTEDQVKEIANGLDRAGHRFLWSLRRPPPEDKKYGVPSENDTFEDALPQGFLDRTAHRGKIIGLAPQVSILAHPAVGGFVSHCGWNSTLESLWFGVPLATWPLYAEQQLNAFELVKELELAVEIKMDYRRNWRTRKGNFLVTSKEIEDGVKKLMNIDKEMKHKVMEMSEQGKKALEEGGSSRQWLDCFITDVLNKS